MSFVDYVHCMSIKYRLAIAIAVLKGKPNELSIEQYIDKLKTKYQNSMEINALNMSICSDDFVFNDDDFKAIHDGFNDSFGVQNIQNDVVESNDDADIEINQSENVNDSFHEVLQMLRDIDDSTEKENNMFAPLTSQSVQIEDSQLFQYPLTIFNRNINTDLSNSELSQGYFNRNAKETQQNVDKDYGTIDKTRQDNINDSQAEMYSQAEENIYNEDIDSQATLYSYSQTTNTRDNMTDSQLYDSQMTDIEESDNSTRKKRRNSCNDIENKTNNKADECNIKEPGDNERKKAKYDNYNNTYDSQINVFSQNFTHVSQSQCEIVDIPKKYIYGNRQNQHNEKDPNDPTHLKTLNHPNSVNIENGTHETTGENYNRNDETKNVNGNRNYRNIGIEKETNDENVPTSANLYTGLGVHNNKESNSKYGNSQDGNRDELNLETIDSDDNYVVTNFRKFDSLMMISQEENTMAVDSQNETNTQSSVTKGNQIQREEFNEINTDTMSVFPQYLINTQSQIKNTADPNKRHTDPRYTRDANDVLPRDLINKSQVENNNADLNKRYTNSMLMIPQESHETQTQEGPTKRNTMELIKKLNDTLEVYNVESSQIQYIIDKDGKMYRCINIPRQSQLHDNYNQELTVKDNAIHIEFNKVGNVKQISHSNTENLRTRYGKTYNNDNKVIQEKKIFAIDDQITRINTTSVQKTSKQDTNGQNTANDKTSVQKTDNVNINKSDINEKRDTSTKIVKEINENAPKPITTENTSQIDETQSEDEYTESQMEIIPFKLVEELNRIKSYLNRGDRKQMDSALTDSSGYKSDSQKSVRNLSQTQSTWLNQSAHCLYNYLLECPLIANTQDITNEVSQVLANLVDRLHEEEHYPPFLSAILETIDNTIQDLYQGNSYGEDVLLKKDENIQRLCLLNKSVHLLQYTIEKLTQKLENVHTNLTASEKMYEITHVDICENICYIFHMLEICLQRYTKVKDVLSQSTQNSQDDERILRKSSIADIWRKKWIPNYKEQPNTDVCMEKPCVLTKCSEILNKIIVNCMEGYSLVSFAALQCFNLLQK